ncbi:MAG: ATP-binding protein [Candidatus Gracilibacteria bacterium]
MSEFIDRKITKEIEDNIFKGKIIIIYGPRQVGKTTLVRALLSKYGNTDDYYNCDEPDIRLSLTNKTSTELRSFFGDKKLIVIDEAQRVENIGITLKLLIDNYPDIQIIATGSSSFDLANKINEPLTGRKYEYHLYPFSIEELNSKYSKLELTRFKDENMIFGLYPEVFFSSQNDKIKNLKILVDSYLYKDILSFGNIRKPDMIIKLLQALALQVGNQVSYTELANLIGVDKNTIENYIIILEKAFIIFRLGSFSRNLRNEIKFSKKIYFYDLGVRNALINNFNPLELRQDTGALWENFLISERIKYNSNNFLYVNSYFWRTFTQQEIDYIEESGDKLSAYEFKYSVNKKPKPLKNFIEAYLKSSFEIINGDNYLDFVM